jgi:hypothetical protein
MASQKHKIVPKMFCPFLFAWASFLTVPHLLAGAGAVALMQFKMTVPLAEIHRTQAEETAVRDLGQARRSVLLAHEQVQQAVEKAQTDSNDAAAQKAAADAQKSLEEAQKQAQDAAQKVAATPDQKAAAPDARVKALQEQLKAFHDHNDARRRFNSNLALAFILSGIALAFVTSVCSFLSLTKTAGVISLLAGALVSVPKVIPVNERADYYRVLSVQSYNLLLESELQVPPTVDQYNDTVRRLKLLHEYEAEKFPSSSNVAETTRDLVQDLEAAKTTEVSKG